MPKRRNSTYGLLSLIFICVVVITVANYQLSEKYVLKTIDLESDETIQELTDEATDYTNERIVDLTLMADYLSFINNSDEEIVSFLNRQEQSMTAFLTFSYYTDRAKMLYAKGTLSEIQHLESLSRAMKGNVTYSSLLTVNDDPLEYDIAIRVPVKKDGKVVGVLSGHLNEQEMMTSIARGTIFTGTVSLVSEKKVLQSSSKEVEANSALPFSDIFLTDMESKQMGNELVDEGDAHFIKYKQFTDKWYIVLDTYSEEHQKMAIAIFWRNYLYIALAIALLLTIYGVIHRFAIRKDRLLKQDLLTGLANRVQLEEDIGTSFKNKGKHPLAFVLMNIDRFNDINERFGFQSGDRVLYEVSKMAQSVSSGSQLYRVGGDEFVMTTPLKSKEEMDRLLEELIKSTDRPIIVPTGDSLWVTIGIGVRVCVDGDTTDVLLQDAKLAVQEAKKLGGNRFVYFTKELAEQYERDRLLAKNIVSALKNNEFHLVYQPLYLLESKKISGYEALLRWNSQALGSISPMEFVPVLEHTDLIIPVGRWVMQEVAQVVNKWEKETEDHFQVAINISIKQLMHPEFINDVKAVINETSVSPEKLLFEITESIAVMNKDFAAEVLKELNDLGIQTALDDFGTGYSSLSILKSLPIQHLKVDRSFIVKMESDGDKSRIILKGIIDIAKGLGLNTVMEGVETTEQLKLLKEMGAQKIQGYLISKPVLPRKALSLREEKWNH